MTSFTRGTSAALIAGLAGLGLCTQAVPAMAAPVPAAPRTPAAAAPITQNQASNLALRILGDNLRSDAVVLKRVAGDHSATIGLNDAGQQQDASIKATWARPGTTTRTCTDEDACTITKLPTGTLYTYDLLGNGFSYIFQRSDGALISLDDLDGQVWWQSTGYHPIDEARIATLLQDKRWNRVLDATGSYVTPTKPTPPVTGSEAPTALAQRIMTSYLVPEARIGSRTLTATSATLTTEGGAETGGYVRAEWMTRGSGPGQYDFDRDCVAKFPLDNIPTKEDTFGTGTLCEQDMSGYEGGPKHDWYYTRGDGRVLHITTLEGAYQGHYADWAPVTDGDVDTMLLDPRWDVVVRKLRVTTPTPQQQAADTALAMLKQYRLGMTTVTAIDVDAARHTARLTVTDDNDRVGYIQATWMKAGSGTGQFDEQRDCLSQPGGTENKNTAVKLECSFTSTDAKTTTYFFSHDWAGQGRPGTVIRIDDAITTLSNDDMGRTDWRPLDATGVTDMFQDARWDQVTATL